MAQIEEPPIMVSPLPNGWEPDVLHLLAECFSSDSLDAQLGPGCTIPSETWERALQEPCGTGSTIMFGREIERLEQSYD